LAKTAPCPFPCPFEILAEALIPVIRLACKAATQFCGAIFWNTLSSVNSLTSLFQQEYRPSWGYKRASDETKDWVIEVPQNADPYEDQFAKRKKVKTERQAKNELQRLRNIARSQKMKGESYIGLVFVKLSVNFI
jgi:hypothetical protein